MSLSGPLLLHFQLECWTKFWVTYPKLTKKCNSNWKIGQLVFSKMAWMDTDGPKNENL